MQVAQEMEASLVRTFQPHRLEIMDESEKHRGHAGYRDGGETHFRVEITADAFASMSRVEQHRAVHDALGKDLLGRIHALELKISA